MYRGFLLLLVVVAGVSAAQPEDDDPDPHTIERLVADLGSDDFRQRESAMIELRKIGDLAIPYLRKQQKSADVEVRLRSRDLLAMLDNKGQILCCTGHDKAVIAVALLPGDQQVLSAGEDKSICLWNLADGKLLRRMDGHTKRVWTLAVAPDGKSFASGGPDCIVRLWNLNAETKPRELATLPDSVRCLQFSADGQQLLAGCFDGKVHVIHVKTGQTSQVWTGHKDAVLCLALSPDGSKVLSGGGFSDASVCLRDARTGAILKRLLGHKEQVIAVAFVDGTHAVSAGADNRVRLWDLKTGNVQREFKGHDGGVYGLAVSRDGKRLLTGADDKIIRLWDLANGDELRRYAQHEEGINALAFTANGRYAVSAGDDRTVRLWTLPRVPRQPKK